ncbi:MAG: glycosyltransferase family 2 protein [Chloroflexi bacterium]|nr:glycosyltransferase family 2 protein [Chloroflexota bacterium]
MSKQATQPKVAIVVLNWRKPAETLACLASLEQLSYHSAQVIVVDNGSDDNSVALIRQHYPYVRVLETDANLGYAGGNNVGIRHALNQGAEYICILNNDVLVAPGFLEPLLAAAVGEDGTLAIASPAVCELGRPDLIWSLGANIVWRNGSVVRLHSGEAYAAWVGRPPFEVDYTPGSAMLVPRKAWEAVGLMDEVYFLYYEEAEWCIRAQRAGFRILAVPNSAVWHEVEAQQGRGSPAVTYYMVRNALRFLRRNLPADSVTGPMLRVALLAHWNVLGDLRRGQFRRAWSRVRGVYDYALNRFGPLK